MHANAHAEAAPQGIGGGLVPVLLLEVAVHGRSQRRGEGRVLPSGSLLRLKVDRFDREDVVRVPVDRVAQLRLHVHRHRDRVLRGLEGDHEAVPDGLHFIPSMLLEALPDDGVMGFQRAAHDLRNRRPQRRAGLHVGEQHRDGVALVPRGCAVIARVGPLAFCGRRHGVANGGEAAAPLKRDGRHVVELVRHEHGEQQRLDANNEAHAFQQRGGRRDVVQERVLACRGGCDGLVAAAAT